MTKKLPCTAILILLSVAVIFAQKKITFNYNTFSSLPGISKEDVKKIKSAEKIYRNKSQSRYKKSLPLYLEVYRKNIEYNPLYWRIAMCYLHSDNQPESIKCFSKCNKSISKYYHFYLAQAYHFDGQFDKAKNNYTLFKKLNLTDAEKKSFLSEYNAKLKVSDFNNIIQNLIESCDVAINSINDSLIFEFTNIKIINSKNDDMFPLLHPDGTLIYSSNKSLIPKITTGHFQIFEVSLDSMIVVGFPKLSNKYPKSKEENHIALSCPETSKNLLYQSSTANRKGEIMMTYNKKGEIEGHSINGINSINNEGTACLISADILVFSSDKTKNDDNSDLFITFRDDDGKWEKPVHIGGSINTPANEKVITFFEKNLYYISDAKGGLGGFDTYKVTYLGKNEWGKPQNLGYPLNTVDDDMGYFPIDETHAFYCGKRPKGEGGFDIYLVKTKKRRTIQD